MVTPGDKGFLAENQALILFIYLFRINEALIMHPIKFTQFKRREKKKHLDILRDIKFQYI